jgi:hypothetical protein
MVIVLPSAPDAASLRASMQPLDAPWMFAVLRAVDDGSLVAAAGTLVRDGAAVPAFALMDDDPARVAAAVRRAIPALAAGQASERETAVMRADELRALERPPAPAAPPAEPSRPMARWLWLAAIALLAVEALLRRRGVGHAEVVTHAA